MGSRPQRAVEACVAMTLAAVALTCAVRSGLVDTGALAVWHGICRELLAGTTEGRQALVGSCWYGPLPSMALACCAWLVGKAAAPMALGVAAWCGWSLVLRRVGRLAGECLVTRLMTQVAAAAALCACGGALNPAVALPVWLALLAAGAAAAWMVGNGLGALATLGFALGALGLCGMALSGWVALLALALPVITWRSAAVRGRLPAVLLLGWLPLAYALGVWALLDWLLLGDPIYFVRSLTAPGVLAWRKALPSGTVLLPLAGALAATACLLALARRRAAGDLLLGLLALGAWGWQELLRASSASWAAGAAEPLALLLAVVALVRVVRPRSGRGGAVTAGVLALLLAVGAWRDGHRQGLQVEPAAMRQTRDAALCREVEADVRARTPYGRVFVCGYEGLALLHDQPRGRLLPNLDLHVGELRRLYYGQTLFILVHRPIGRAAADSIHWRFPATYQLGLERAIYTRDFGDDWRLFTVVGAPTEEQLRAWRK